MSEHIGERKILDWPDAAGLWWCDKSNVVEQIIKIGSDMVYFDDERDRWIQKTEWPFGPARFTKLLEQNPFEPNDGK